MRIGTKPLSDWAEWPQPYGHGRCRWALRGALTARPGLVLQGRYVALRKLKQPATKESYQQLA